MAIRKSFAFEILWKFCHFESAGKCERKICAARSYYFGPWISKV